MEGIGDRKGGDVMVSIEISERTLNQLKKVPGSSIRNKITYLLNHYPNSHVSLIDE